MLGLSLCALLALFQGVVSATRPDPPRPSVRVRFVDVTAAAGLRFTNVSGEANRKDYIFEAKGGGLAALDFDNDGWMDLVFAQGSTVERARAGTSPRPALFRNRGDGTFEDVTARAGLTHRGWGMGVAAADYDNDGWPDLYMTYLGPDVLYRNKGDGTFEDVTARAGIVASGWSASAAFGDVDRDGDLDLYVTGYLDVGPEHLPEHVAGGVCAYIGQPVLCGPRGLPGARDYFFLNNGDGTFSERSAESGAIDRDRYFGLGVVMGDLDDDNDPDIFVGNDATPNLLFVNRGDGHFDERGYPSGLAVSGEGNEQASMGLDLADFDNDGRLDAYSTHFAHDFSTLYHNLGGGLFEDVTVRAEVQRPEWPLVSWGTRFVDLDLDGWKDIVHANGHVYPFLRGASGKEVYEQPALTIYLNAHDGTFRYATPEAGPDAAKPIVGRGAAFADFDGDGDVDVAIACLNGPPLLLRNDVAPGRHWIMLRTVGRESNRDGIGARITVTTGGLKQTWEIKRTVGIYSSSDPRAHFGLGEHSRVDLLHVRWPSGRVSEIRNVPADAHYVLDETAGLSLEPVRGR